MVTQQIGSGAALGGVWAMERSAFDAMRASFASLPMGAAPKQVAPLGGTGTGQIATVPKPFEFAGGVAILDVQGPIFQRATYLSLMYADFMGACITEVLGAQFDAAMSDPDVGAILMRVNTPGGQASGMDAFSQKVFDARGQKPIVAHVDGFNCSGGYFFTSPCDAIYGTRDSVHGCIGTYMSIANYDEANAMEGIQEVEIVSSVSPDKVPDELTPEGVAIYQHLVDALGQNFVDAVARNRGLSSESVVSDYGQGGVKVGADALGAGMIDGIASFEAVLGALQSAAQSSGDAASVRKALETPQGTIPQGRAKTMVKGILSILGINHEVEIPPALAAASAESAAQAAPVVAVAAPVAAPVIPVASPSQTAELAALHAELLATRTQNAARFATSVSSSLGGEAREEFEAKVSTLHLRGQQNGFAAEVEAVFGLLPTSTLGATIKPAANAQASTNDASGGSTADDLEQAGEFAKSVVSDTLGKAKSKAKVDKSLYANLPSV